MSIVDLRKLLMSALVLLSMSAIAFAPQAIAQDSDGDAIEDAVEAIEEEEEDAIENIVVTGSRIKRTEFNSSAPITIITNERSQLAGLMTSAEILQGSTIASGEQRDDTFAGFINDGGPGANTLSLRGLGAQRTLILVNGKRWGPSGVRGSTNSVDLTALPTAAISRYEILKDGASSVYGADAVAGVVNAITKERFEGFQVNARAFVPEGGGGEGYALDAIWGNVGDNHSINVSAVYGTRDRLVMADRDWSRCDQRPRVDGANRDPATGQELCYGMIYGFAVTNFGWLRYEPSLTDVNDTSNPFYDPLIQGQQGIPLWTSVPLNDLPNQGEYWVDEKEPFVQEMIPPGDIWSLNSFGDLDFSMGGRNATAYYEFYYNHRETESLVGYRQFFPTTFAGFHPGNPGFGFALPVIPSYEIQDRTQLIDIDRTNTFIGLKGDMTENWSYDVYAGHSWSEGTYEFDMWLDDRVVATSDAELDTGGNLVCTAAALAQFPDCVAADFFAEDALLNGRLPPDYLDFISKYTFSETEYTSVQFAGYITGPLFEMPAGEVQTVIGFETRTEEINDVPDIESQNDNYWGFTGADITAGEDTVNEIFLEAEVPLLTSAPLAEELTLNGSWRYTDYDSYGSDDTYRIALNWQMLSWLRLRGTKGTSFRAPDLFEQFLGNQTGFVQSTLVDPCINYGSLFDPDDIVYQNCAAEGVPPDLGSAGSRTLRTVTGGNPNLNAETSTSWTAGFVIQPGEGGFSLAVNWFEIDLQNTVSSPTVSFILNDCYGSVDKSSPFCARVAPRNPQDWFLEDVDASLLNVGLQKSRGQDIDLLYQKDFSSFDLTIDATATHLSHQEREVLGVTDFFHGRWSYPTWSADVDFQIDYRDWTFFWNVDYIGSMSEDPRDNRIHRADQVTYNAFSVRYRASNWELIGTVRNAFDVTPPIVSDGMGSQSGSRAFNTIIGTGYDIFGRSYTIQASMGFL